MAVQYTVAFNKTSSSVSGAQIPSIVANDGNKIMLPTAALWNWSDHVFVGWSLTSGGSVQYYAGDLYTVTAAVTFYAVWALTSGTGARTNTDIHIHQDASGTTTIRRVVAEKYHFKISTNIPNGQYSLTYWTRPNGSRTVKVSDYNPDYATNPTVTETIESQQGSATYNAANLPTGSDNPSVVPSYADLAIPGARSSFYSYMLETESAQVYKETEVTERCELGDDWMWTAPEISNYEFEGWYTLDQSYAYESAITPTNANFTTKISSARVISFDELCTALNSVCTSKTQTSEDDAATYLNYVQLRYLGKRIQVLFDTCDGEIDDFDRLVRFGKAYGELPTPTRSAYTFAGWYTSSSGGTLVTSATVVSISTDHILYAHWTANPTTAVINVYFDAEGGTCSDSSRTVTEGSAYGTLPTPTKSGYTFLGWFTSGGTEVTAATVAGDEDTVVSAKWRGNTSYTVTFDANGGTCSESTRTVYAGATVGSLPTATKSDSKFGGWFTSEGTEVNASTVISSSITLTARWNAESSNRLIVRYKIKLTLNGGTLADTYECKYTRGIAKALPTETEVTRTGYTFAGWYANEDFSGSAATEIPSSASGTQKFYAKWN